MPLRAWRHDDDNDDDDDDDDDDDESLMMMTMKTCRRGCEHMEGRRFEADASWLGPISANSQLFWNIGSTNIGRIAGRISGAGGTSSRQHAKKHAKVSKNRPQTLQNRALGPPKSSLEPSKTPFFKDT